MEYSNKCSQIKMVIDSTKIGRQLGSSGKKLNKIAKDVIKETSLNKEFNLSEWITYIEERKAYFVRDIGIKEFIKKTVEDFNNVTLTIEDIEIRFKKRVGDKFK